MATNQELRVAISKGQYALVKKLAEQLQNNGIDISSEIEFAQTIYNMKGKTESYRKVLIALGLN